ncbi:MAG: two-component regulator propeller domain-containing protein [Bacteroidota bacterium]
MKNIFCILAIFMSSLLKGQTPAYLHYNVEDGMPSNKVYSAIQDKKGFMWFGTDNGLARFDGSRFKVYNIEDGLPDPEVLNLFEDSQERLWISCFQQRPCYLKDGKFYTSQNDSLVSKIDLKASEHYFKEFDDGTILINGSGGKYNVWFYPELQAENHYDIEKYVEDNNLPDYLNKYIDTSIIANKIKLVSLIDRTEEYINGLTRSHPPLMLYQKKQNERLYFYYRNKIIDVSDRRNLENGFQYLNIPPTFNQLQMAAPPYLWYAYPYDLSGIYQVNIDNNKTTSYLTGKQTSMVYQDLENTMWFGTLNDGVYAMREKQTVVYKKSNVPVFKTDNITAISVLENGHKMIGDAIGNIYHFQNNSWREATLRNDFRKSRIRQIIGSSEANWIYISDLGIYSEKNGKMLNISGINRSKFRSKNHVVSPKYIIQDQGIVYVCSITGLNLWENGLESPPKFIYKNNRATAVSIDSEQNIWVGGNGGLLSSKDSFMIPWGERFKQLKGRIIDIKAAANNHLWVASAENHLIKVQVKNGEVINALSMNDTLPVSIKNIKHLFKSADETLWISTNAGIYGLDEQLNVRYFDTTDGLPTNDVNAVAVQNDTLWAATTAGLAKIQLNRQIGSEDFSTYISSVSYELDQVVKEIELVYQDKTKVTLPAGASSIGIQLSGLHFNSAGILTFELIEEEKLLPLQWVTWDNLSANISKLFFAKNDTTLLHKAHKYYGTYVPKGSFQITATAIAKDGARSLRPDKKVFTFLPFWYETIWFSLFIIGFSGYAIWLFVRQYTRAKRFQRAASELQLAAIKAQVNPHFVGNSINAIQQFFYPPDPMTASKYIATFTSLLRQTMHLSEIPFISFEKELSFITDYLEMVKLRFGDRFEYQINKENNIKEAILFPAMILQPILENATIHGFAPEGVSFLNVTFEIKENKLITTITDNGIGIEASRKIKKTRNKKRVSKGIRLLQDKINVMNKMYGLDLKIEYSDLASSNKNRSGTQVSLSYSPNKITP